MSMNQSSLLDKFIKGGTRGSASNMFIEGDVLYSYGHHFPMLVRTSFGYLLNADKYSSTTSSHQSGCMKHATIQIPFSVLRAAGIIKNYGSGWGFDEDGIKNMGLVKAEKQRWDWTGRWVTGYGKDQKVITNTEYKQLPEANKELYNKQEERRPESAIVKAGGKFFLSSMDGWNYFMCELPEPVTTIPDAFELLKPKEVIGKEFIRQGEWFFVETEVPATLLWDAGNNRKMYKLMGQKFELPKKRPESNSHIATRGCQLEDNIYVSGQIRHVTRFGGRGEHRMLTLSHADEPKIFLAYENRAVASYSASGRVD